MPAKPTKKHADALLSPKPTGAGRKKSRPQKRRVEKRKTKIGDGAPKRRPASDPSKRHSGAKTRNRGARSPNGPGRRPRRKSRRSPQLARSAFRSKRKKKGQRPPRDGGPGRTPKNRWCPLVAKRRVAGPERSRSPVHSSTTKESECAAW